MNAQMFRIDPTVVRQIELPEADICLRKDGIVHVHYKKNTTLDVELQQSMRIKYRELTGSVPSKFIFTADEGFLLTKEARESSRSFKDPFIVAYAVIANNLAYRIIANFFLKVNKPEVPFKLFASIKDAESWLQSI
jgi:hypothetical protein